MGAGAHDDFAIGVDQRVGLARERRDLDREGALQPFRRAGADRRQAFGDALERREAEADLEGDHQQQHRPEHAEGEEQRAVEAARLLVDLGRVAGDRDQEAALFAEIDRALDHAQLLVLRAFRVAVAGAAGAERAGAIRELRQPAVPQRARRAHVGRRRVEPRHLPVPARQRQLEQRLAERLRELVGVLLRGRDVGDQSAQIDVEPAVEGALHRRAVERGQHDPGDDENQHGPGRRREEQP